MSQLVEAPNHQPKMLIADDDPLIVRVLADRCARMGFLVDTATNGLQALLKANKNAPDVLVIDVNMPEVDGLSVCAHLLDPSKRPLHVIVVTGSRDPETVERCESFGAFYAKKGPEFWGSLEASLIDLFPEMADAINGAKVQLTGEVVKTRSRVLVVDNDPNAGVFLSSRLAKHGVEMLYAADAQQGYRMACRDEPSVIISDYSMPNGDAQYLLTKLRTTPATAKIPFIVLSEQPLDDVTQQVLRREIAGNPGAAKVLVKSNQTNELFEALEMFCGFEKLG